MAIAGVVLASFAAPAAASADTGTVAVSKAGGAVQGSRVTSFPAGIDCGSTCSSASASFPSGTSVALHADPAAGTTVNWQAGCLGLISGDGQTCTVAAPSGGGTITVTPTFTADDAGAQPVTFHVQDTSGIAQRAYMLDEPGVPNTDAAGNIVAYVAAGQTWHFSRNMHVGNPPFGGLQSIAPPEGAGGQAYTVPNPPADATITLPDVHLAFHPELSTGERWVVGMINQARQSFGSPPLHISATLSRAADALARDEALNARFPDPQFWVTPQDAGWPGDPYIDGFVMADDPVVEAARVVPHWDGSDASDPESGPIWNQLKQPAYTAVGIGDGDGAWIIYLAPGCPDATAAGTTACAIDGSNTGDTTADHVGPAITISGPADGAHFAQGAAAAASYSCSDANDAVATCDGTVPNGQPIDTSAPGAHTFTVRASDSNGNNSLGSVSYTVDAPSTATAGTSGTSAPVPPHRKKKKKKHHHHH